MGGKTKAEEGKKKKTVFALSVPTIFVWDRRFVTQMTLRSKKKKIKIKIKKKKGRKEKRNNVFKI